MNQGQSIFSQLLSVIPRYEFNKCVLRYDGNHRVRRMTCWEQFAIMCFAQLTFRESLRDIESCLLALGTRLYHCGIRCRMARATLADANELRDSRIYSDLAHWLIPQARKLYHDDRHIDFEGVVYAFDSSTIDLCLTLFPWAQFRREKSAVKLHTQMDIAGSIPTFIKVTSGAIPDVLVLQDLVVEPGAYYLLDRGYVDFEQLYRIHNEKGYFIMRSKDNLIFQRTRSLSQRTSTVICDQMIRLRYPRTSGKYPEQLRRIKIIDNESQKTIIFLTNHFELTPETVGELYRQRWRIELFFKWIKQNLRIKSFYGCSVNAVTTQIWIAVCVYLMVAILKKRLSINHSMSTIMQVIGVSLFEKIPIQDALALEKIKKNQPQSPNQLKIFDF